MERSEPSLVPQWLKGASSGGVGGATHYSQTSSTHQDESGGAFALRQRVPPHGVTSGGSHVDYDAPRFPPSPSTDRAYYSAVRRGPGGGSTGINDRSIQDRETFSRGYTNFGRSTTYRSYDAGLDRSDRDAARERDWDWDRDGRDRGRVLGGFGGSEERERDRNEQSDSSSAFRRPGLGQASGGRYEADIPAPLRRVQSMGSAARALENGEKKPAEQGNLPTAPPTNSGSLTSSMQKAAFERNFPSLGAQERGAVMMSGMQSNLGSLVISSPRPSWQGPSTSRMDGIRSAASSPGLPTGGSPGSGLSSTTPGGSNGEVWSSALAEAPTVVNGTAVAPLASPSSVITSPTSALANIPVTGNTTNPPKMVEALVQHPPRVRTPPQYSAEKERLEERALMQSRQLIPMVPKTPGPNPRDKKVERVVHSIAPPSIMKPRQAIGTSQVLNSPYRPPASRPEALKLGQGTGKILSRKVPIKEVVPVLSPSSVITGFKSDPSPVVATAVGLPGLGLGTGVGVLNSAPRKQKQLLDRRAVPIPPVSLPVISDGNAGGLRLKDGSAGPLSGGDERRPSAPTQNRVDFFNALRRKAGLGGTPNIVDKLDVAPPKSNDMVNGEEVGNDALPEESVHLDWEDVAEHPVVDSYPLENGDRQENDTTLDAEGPCSDVEHFGTEGKENGEFIKGTTNDQLFKEADGSLQQQLARGEEVEIPFLISLGWNRAKAEETDALTQDEIDAFIQKRNELTSLPAAQQRSSSNHHYKRMELQVGSIGSETSCVTSSDSESEDDFAKCGVGGRSLT